MRAGYAAMTGPQPTLDTLDGASAEANLGRRLLRRLEALGEQPVVKWWDSLESADWPTLFRLLTVAADLPLFADHRPLRQPPRELWPQLASVADDMLRLQRLVQCPTVPQGTRLMPCLPADDGEAGQELRDSHCVTVSRLFDRQQEQQLDRLVNDLRVTKEGSWGALERSEACELFGLFDTALASQSFRRLTGYEAARDTYSLTLSLQSLQAEGIGWHQDLYWPREWIGEDVFAVLYGLSEDTADKGGAFVYYVPWHNEIRAVFRRHHQATVLWNAKEPEGRLLHAVSHYHGDDTRRPLIILQCLRRTTTA